MKSKNKLLTCLLLAVFLVAVSAAVTLLATGCGDPAEIAKPTVGTASFVYNGTEQGPAIAASDDYTIGGDLKATNVGSYTVTVSLKDKEKTVWKGGDNADLTFTYAITQADNAFTTEYATADYTYGETPSTTAAAAKFGTPTVKYYSDAACTQEIADMKGFAATTAVGTYYVKVDVAGTDNYKALTKTYTVVVDKIAIAKPTVETTEFTYNGEAQGIEIAESDKYTVTGDQKKTDAGEYEVTVALKDKTNYKWADADSDDLTFKYTIAKADNAFTTEYATADYTYGETPSTTAAAAKFGTPAVKYYTDAACTQAVDGMTGFAATTDAGTYYVKVSVAGTDNYNELSKVYTVVVGRAEVTVPTATEDAFVYDGASHNIVVPASDLYTVTSQAQTEKGEYTATVALKDKTNYKWKGADSADVTLDWTISAALNGWKTEFNVPDYVFGGTPSVTDAASEFGEVATWYYYDEDCTQAVDGMTGFGTATPAGTYYVKVSVEGNGSYGGLSKVYTVVVKQCGIAKPTVETTEFTYNGEAQGIEIAESDKYTVIGGQKQTNAGTYTVTVALKDPANYKWAGADSEDLTITYTIAKAVVERPAVDVKPLAYNGKEQTVFDAPDDAEYNVTGNKAKDVGDKYTVVFKLNDTKNYEWAGGGIKDIEVAWKITRGTATVTSASDLAAAVADKGYDVVKLNADINISAVIKIDHDVTLDLGAYKLGVVKGSDAKAFGDANYGGVALRVNKGGELTIKGESGTIDGTAADKVVPVAAMGGNVTIESGTIKVNTSYESCVFARYGGKVTINGGKFINEFTGEYAHGGGVPLTLNVGNNTNGVDDAKGGTGVIEVQGGEFVGRSPEKGDDKLGGNFVAGGVKVAGNLESNTYYVLAAGATVPTNVDYVRYYGDAVGGVASAVSADAYNEKGLAEVISVSKFKLMNDISVDASVFNLVTDKNNGSLTLDLNQKALTLTTTNNSGTTVVVENGFALTLENGKLNANNAVSTTACFNIGRASTITLDGVTVESTGSVLFPQGDAAAVNVMGSTITTTGVYGVATNAGKDDNYGVVITIKNSTITASPTDGDGAAVMINVDGKLDITNSTINGTRQGVIVRAGDATLTNVNVNVDLKYAGGIDRDVNPAKWGGGNEVAYGALVVGNNTANTYKADANVTVKGGSLNCTTALSALADHTNAVYAARLNSAVYTTAVTLDGAAINGQVVNHQGTATLTGLPSGTQVVNALVNGADNLGAALKAAGYVKLVGDITANAVVESGKDVTLDLGSYKLTGNVTVTTGRFTVNSANKDKGGITGCIVADGETAEIVINGGKFANNNAQLIRLENGAKGTINGGEFVWTYADGGNTNMIQLGSVSSGNATLTVNDGKFDSTGYAFTVLKDSTLYYNGGETVATWTAISGNNTVPSANIYITGGTLKATEDTVVYMPSAGVLEITGGTLTGNSVVDIRQGKLTVGSGATLNATKANWSSLTKKPGGTTIADGSAIIVNAYFYNSQIANKASSIEININPAATVTASSGKLITVYNWNSVEQKTVYDFGGFAAGYYEFIDGTVVEVAQAATAEELKAAVNNARVVMLTADIEADVEIASSSKVKLDLNGHKLTNASNHTIVNKGNLTVTDTSADKSGVIDNVTHAKAAVWNEVGAKFTLEAGTLTRSKENGKNASDNGGNSYYVLLNHGTAYISGGAITQNGHYSSLIENGWQNGNQNTAGANSVMVISGGEFSGGLNTVKNDDYGDLTISGGTFANNSQAAVLNWNIAEITGGTFTVNGTAHAVIFNGKHDDIMDKGQLAVTGGEFAGADIFARHSEATYGGTITVNTEALRDAALAIEDATVVYEQENNSTAYVGDEAALAEYVRGGGFDIVLTDDIMLSSTVEVAAENTIVFDLNGHIITVTQTDGRSLYAIDNYGTLTLKDSSADESGKIIARGVENKNGGTMYMLSGTIEACDNGGGAALWNEGKFFMSGGTLAYTGEKSGNNAGSSFNGQAGSAAEIVGGSLQSAYTSIASSGELTVKGLTLANSVGFWHCVKVYSGTTKLENVTINSTYGGGMEVAGGRADVSNCTFTQKEYYDCNSTLMAVSSGGVLNIDGGAYGTTNSTGTSENYGLYVFSSGGTINVYGGTFAADKTVLKADNTAYTHKSVINVYGGNFTGGVEIGNDPAKASMTVSGGTFSVDVGKYCADGKACDNTDAGVYEIVDVDQLTAKIVKAIVSVDGMKEEKFTYETTDDNGDPLTRTYSYTLIEFNDLTITKEVRDELLIYHDLFDPDVRNVVVTVGTGNDKWYVVTGDYRFTDDYLLGTRLLSNELLFTGHNTVINNFPCE